MILPLKKEYNEVKATQLARRLQRISLSDVVDVIEVKESIITDTDMPKRLYDITLFFEPLASKIKMKWNRFQSKLEKQFLPSLMRTISRILRISNPAPMGKLPKYEYIDSVVADIEITPDQEEPSIALPKKKKSEDDDVSEDLGTGFESEEEDNDLVENEDEEKNDEEEEKDSDEEDNLMEGDIEEGNTSKTEEKNEDKAKSEKMIGIVDFLKDYSFDKKTRTLNIKLAVNAVKLLMVSLLEKQCENFMLQEVKGISRCALLKPTKNESRFVIQTEGIDIKQVWRMYSIIDVNDIGINDLMAIYTHYGIEAARAAIIKEVSAVFNAYGIGVNFRHLSLIADFMTFEGYLKSFNRIGARSNPSPLFKMSFETAVQFLKEAVLAGEYDAVLSPSSSIVIGNPPEVGTGIFDLRVDLKKILDHQKSPELLSKKVRVAQARVGLL